MSSPKDDDWQDFWLEDGKPDAMSYVILIAGVVAIVLMVTAWVFMDEVSIATKMMTER